MKDNPDSDRRRPKGTEFVGVATYPHDPAAQAELLHTLRREALLVRTSGPSRGAETAIERELTLIGRDDDADVTIDEPAASRRHAAIVRREAGFFLRDLGSTNGTYLKRVLHSSEEKLSDGDCFQIGETAFLFRDVTSREEPAPDAVEIESASDPEPEPRGILSRLFRAR